MSPPLLLLSGLVLTACVIDGVIGENLLSASVQWIPVNQTKVLFTYHLAWTQTPVRLCPVPNTEIRCAAYLDGTFLATFPLLRKWVGDYRWECTEGCHPIRPVANMSGLYYKNISTLGDNSWESAVETVELNFGTVDELENIALRFLRPDGTPIAGLGDVKFGRTMRQDTNRTNIGPLVSVMPFYRVPIGESVQIGFYPYDGDGDHVRCKWGGTSPRPAIQLDEDNCMLHVNAGPSSGFKVFQEIPLSLYAEDFSCDPVRFGPGEGNLTTGPFSRAPFMVTVVIGHTLGNRSDAHTTTNDVGLGQNAVTLLSLPIRSFKTKFPVTHGNTRHYLSTGPRFMQFQANTAQTTVEAVWDVKKGHHMTGIHQACVMFYDDQGMLVADTKCAIFFIGGEDRCRSHPCPGGGVCQSWYNHSTCGVQIGRARTCSTESPGVADFLKKYIRYLIYGGSAVLGLLGLMTTLCLCHRCCCGAGKKDRQARRRQVKVRPRYPDPDW